ncbi:MAG: hypothetical protein AAGJ70_06755 [Pseudomonadota bacterium]
MTVDGPISPSDAAGTTVEGRSFLHQQGATVCRGLVESLSATEASWELVVRRVEYRDKATGGWVLKRDRDDYGGVLDHCSFYLHPDGRLEISDYGMVFHIAPDVASPWTTYDWPALDSYPGGPMRG